MTDPLRDYYRSAIFRLPPQSGWRQFRFRLRNGAFFTVPATIDTPEDLREWLLRMAPLDCWVSSWTAINPSEIGKKEGSRIMASVIVAEADYTHLVWARRNALKTVELFGKLGLGVRRIVFSGLRSMQVWSEANQSIELTEEGMVRGRREILRAMKVAGINVDVPVFLDPRRIYRVEGTLHGISGNICTGFTPEELASDHWHMKIVHMVDMPKAPPERKSVYEKAPEPRTYILSSICGTRGRQVVCLRYSRQETAAKDADELDKAGHDVFMLKGKYHWLVLPGSYEQEQAMKLTRGSRADPEFLDLTNRLSYSMVEEDAKILYFTRNGSRPTSRAHMAWLGRKGGTVGSMELVRRKLA